MSSRKKYAYRKVKPTIVELEWVDACTVGGSEWLEKEDTMTAAKSKLPCMYTIGYIVFENDDQISLVSVIGPAESSQVHKIPKSMIINERRID
jgi:hypothetical protein